MKLTNHFHLLQVNDALFPIGAYSHSYGLETYIQKGFLKTKDDAQNYLWHKLRYSILYSDLFAARLAWEYASSNQLDPILWLNQITEAGKVPAEIRDASKKMGSRFIKTLAGLDLPFSIELLLKYRDAVGSKNVHHAILYGMFCALAGIDEVDTLSHYLYGQTSAIVTTCVKSIPLSQTDGQIILTASFPLLNELIEEVQHLDIAMYGCSAPAFDIRSMQHESLYSRIYMS